jgi:predicted KAP-like P-loop ATPase
LTIVDDQLVADRPLQNPGDDRLGYGAFAKHLADSFTAMIGAEGLVIALYGAWGSGKSTLLNFVEYYLSQKQKKRSALS